MASTAQKPSASRRPLSPRESLLLLGAATAPGLFVGACLGISELLGRAPFLHPAMVGALSSMGPLGAALFLTARAAAAPAGERPRGLLFGATLTVFVVVGAAVYSLTKALAP